MKIFPSLLPTTTTTAHLKGIVVLLQEAGHVVGDAPGEVSDDELIALHAGLLVVGVRIASVVLLEQPFRQEPGGESHESFTAP